VQEEWLSVVMTSRLSGHVATLGFDQGASLPQPSTREALWDRWAWVEVPDQHAVMTSFDQFQLVNHGLVFAELYTSARGGNRTGPQREWHRTGQHNIPARLYRGVAVLSLRLYLTVLYSGNLGSGLKMRFSFHPPHHLPQEVGAGVFDCSRHYHTFRQHLDCNMEMECQHGEDETALCPYSSAECKGQVAAGGGKCLFFIFSSPNHLKPDTNTNTNKDKALNPLRPDQFSWNTGSDECRKQRGQPASITDRSQLNALQNLWRHSKVNNVHSALVTILVLHA
jgi:hypothetical protein